MKSCEFEPLIGPYHDGELQNPRLQQVAEHLHSCTVCQRRLEEFRELTARLGGLSINGMSQIEQARMHWVVERARADLASRGLMRLALPLAGLAASLLVVTSVWLADHSYGPGDSSGAATVADSESSDWQQVALTMHSNNKLPDWMVRSLGGDQP